MNATEPPTFLGNATNCTVALPQDGSGDTLSQGSAAFIAIALVFGCMTQLPGSLVTGEANRFWRISPLLCFAETLIIFVRIIVPLYNSICTKVQRLGIFASRDWHLARNETHGGTGLKVKAYVLLAERLGNSRKYNYWLKQQWKEAAPSIEDIVSLLDEVSQLERGATLRPIVIIPMVLQFCKLVIIQGDFYLVKALPLVYFWSWFAVEFLLLMVHGDKLSEMEMLDAERVLLLSVAPTEMASPRRSRQERMQARRQREEDIELGNLRGPDDAPAACHSVNGPDSQTTPAFTAPPDQRQRMAEVAAETEQLMASVVGQGNVPRNRITFRGNRRSLRTMQGKGSNAFYQTLVGIMAGFFESFACDLMALFAIRPYLPIWLMIISYFVTASIIPTYITDAAMGFLICWVWPWVTSSPSIHNMSATRNWTSFKVMVAVLVYFAAFYTDEGTSKPPWLDWLG